MDDNKIGGIVVSVIALVVVIGGIFGSFEVINPGEVGIVTRVGTINRVMLNGFNLKIPFVESVDVFDVRTNKEQVDAQAASKDLQTVRTVIAVQYNLEPEKVGELYQTVGVNFKERIIDPAVQESVKASTAKYTAEELVTKRDIVREEIQNSLTEKLANNHIIVTGASIVDFDFSPSFNQAIEAKVTAEQNALASKNNLEKAKYDAEAIKITSEAANNEKYIQLKSIEVQREAVAKWNGVLPSYTGGQIPFINVK
jgi:regulator of protease activity HflC (stomatin/prohibitin superfamily)